jgi:hypothetical protein
MKAFITKYALSRGVGIQEIEAEVCADINPEMIKDLSPERMRFNTCYHGKGREWCSTREDAVKRAEEMRTKKIAALEKQIKKLKAMTF